MTLIAVVTGASRGLGRAITELLHARGYNVITGQRTQPPPLPSKSYLSASTPASTAVGGLLLPNVKWLHVDLADPDSVSSFVEEVVHRLRLPHVDLLVNNAAVCPDDDSDDDGKHHEWDGVMQTNVKAHAIITHALYPLLARSPAHARVVNVSSGDGEMVYFDDRVQVRLTQLDMCDDVGRFVRDVDSFCQWLYPHRRWLVHSCNGQISYKVSKALLNALSRMTARMWSSTRTSIQTDTYSMTMQETQREEQDEQNKKDGRVVSVVTVCPGDVRTNMMDDIDLRTNVGGQDHDNEHQQTVSAEEVALNLWHVLDVSTSCGYLHGLFIRDGQVLSW